MAREYLDSVRPIYSKGGKVAKTAKAMTDILRNWVNVYELYKAASDAKALQLQAETAAIPVGYNGGDTESVRRRYWQQEPVMRHAVDSIANRYGINPMVLVNRLENEGFVDHQVQDRNKLILAGQPQGIARGYEILHDSPGRGTAFKSFGLDDSATYIDNGFVNLINEQWAEEENENEQHRKVRTANGETIADNIGIQAAMLKAFRNQAMRDFPGLSSADYDRMAVIYYNRGQGGGRSFVRRGGKDNKYSIRKSYASGGPIHINPANRGKFNATMARTGKTAEELKHSPNPLTRKRATFAINARKWHH